MDCLICQQTIHFLKRIRKEIADPNNKDKRYYVGRCKPCKAEFHYSEDKSKLFHMTYAFAHGNTIWRMSYQLDINRTFYKYVRQVKTKHFSKDQWMEILLRGIFDNPIEKYEFEGLLLPSRFQKLVVYS